MPYAMSLKTPILPSGGESKSSEGLHLNPSLSTDSGILAPMRFQHRFSPTEKTASGPVFQDVVKLTRSYPRLVEKVHRNLCCRLDTLFPKKQHWYMPWRKSQKSDYVFKLFLAHQHGNYKIFNTIEVNEVNWPDIQTLLCQRTPGEICLTVEWWFKEDEECCPDEVFEDCKN